MKILSKSFLLLIVCLWGMRAGSHAQVKFPYQDTNLSAEERAKDIVSRMTLDEKIDMMQNESKPIPRLGIKAYEWWNEALHGVGRSGLATVFPQCIGMAASFNDLLLHEVYTAVSDEARAKSTEYSKAGGLKLYQGLTFWTPNINIFRDPRWGRGQETYGEDPYLTSVMGMSVVRGLQGPADSKYSKLHACAKHFAVHSGPEWNRHVYNAENISPRDLWETYLPAFKALVQKAGVKEVMCAYNRYEGEPCCSSNRLLEQILREEWGYKGIVVSDCWAINDLYTPGHHFTEPDSAHASATAVISGTDLECGKTYESLGKAVQQGLIDVGTIDRSVTRLMKARFELGEMDEDVSWRSIPYSVVDSKEHRALAAKMSRQTMVLLQNKNDILPLDKRMKIALMGPNLNDSVMQWGNYNGFPSHTVTLLEGLQRRFPARNLIVEKGCDHTSTVRLESMFRQCAIDGEQGMRATYWNNRRPEGEPIVKMHVKEPIKYTTAGATVFAPGVEIGEFCGLYETVIRVDKSEDIVFSWDVQGSAVMEIDGRQVAAVTNNGSPRAYVLKAEAGKDYRLRLTYTTERGEQAASRILHFNFGREVPLDLSASIDKVKDADIVVFAGGISPRLEGEEMQVTVPGFRGGDRTNIDLPEVQLRLLRQLRQAGKKIVYVNYSGSAIALTEVASLCDGIIQAWYPGEEGGEAVASVLYGETNPAGRLPVTFYRSTAQLPDFENYNMTNRTYRYMTEKPLFPFGYGLSYTKFDYGQAKLSDDTLKSGKTVKLTIPVTNAGGRDGEEVVQVYVCRPGDGDGPSHTLRGFRRVNIKAGQTAQVELTIDAESLEWFDTSSNTMRAIPGTYELMYGGSSDKQVLKKIKIDYKL